MLVRHFIDLIYTTIFIILSILFLCMFLWKYLEDHVLRWLDWIFQALSIYYVAIKKDMENRLPQLSQTKDEQWALCCHRCRHSNAIMTSLSIFPCIPHFSSLGFFFEIFFHQYLPQCSRSLSKIYENAVSNYYFGMKFLWSETQCKLGNLDVFSLSLEKTRAFDNFTAK